MMKWIAGFRLSLAPTLLLMLMMVPIASAHDFGPRKQTDGGRNGGQFSVTEPAAFVLLGAGLVWLGLYAKKKRGKNQ